MAINRYSKLTPLQHTGSFFELPTEMLQNAVMAKQEQYDAQQEAYDTYLTALSSMEMLPQDITESDRRRETLMTKEKTLRDQFGGDLAASGYAQGFSDILRADATDPFYRRATFNLAQSKLWQQAVADYTTKNGVAPQAWQDPFGTSLKSYQGATQTSLPLFSGIQQNIQFQPYVIENNLKHYLDREIKMGTVKIVNTPNGPIYVNEVGERLKEEEIYDILKKLNLENSDAYKVLRMQWEADQGGVKTAVPDFNQFYDQNLRAIAAQTARTSVIQTYAGQPSGTSGGGGNNTRTPYGNGGPTDDEIVSGLIPRMSITGAVNPTAFENRNTFAQYRSNLIAAKKQERDNAVSAISEQLQTSEMNIDYGVELSVVPNNNTGSNNAYTVLFSYTQNGQRKQVDIANPAILMDSSIPPDLMQSIRTAFPRIQEVAGKLRAYDYALEQANQLDRTAFEAGFGAGSYDEFRRSNTGWVDQWKKEYPSKADKFLDVTNLRVTRQLLENFPSFQDAFAAGRSGRLLNVGGRNELEHLELIATRAFGSSIEQLLGPDWRLLGTQGIHAKLMEIFKPGEMNDYLNRFDNKAAYEAFHEENSSKFKEYLKTFERHWELGISADGRPLRAAGQGSSAGIRQNTKTLYSLNTSATPEGNRYSQVMNELVVAALGSNGLFEMDTNEKITEEDRERFALVNEDNQPNYTVAGITFDDEGMNIVVTLFGDAATNKPPKNFEIRGQGQNIAGSVARLGLGNDLMLKSTDEMLDGFMTEEKASSQEEGQRRSNLISTINTGYMKLPVTKAITDQIINGRLVKEGTLIYKSIFGGDPVYSSDPLDIVKAAFADSARVQAFSDPNEYRSVANENYTSIGIESSIVENGNANASQAIRTVLSRIDQQAAAIGANLHITSLNRPGPGNSAHAFGDAVDIRVIRDNQIDMKAIEAVKVAMTQLNSLPGVAGLYDVLLEFKDRSHPQLAELTRALQGTPIKLFINPRATAPHIHIEFNRSQLAR